MVLLLVKAQREGETNSSTGQGHMWSLQRWRGASRIFALLQPKLRCATE